MKVLYFNKKEMKNYIRDLKKKVKNVNNMPNLTYGNSNP